MRPLGTSLSLLRQDPLERISWHRRRELGSASRRAARLGFRNSPASGRCACSRTQPRKALPMRTACRGLVRFVVCSHCQARKTPLAFAKSGDLPASKSRCVERIVKSPTATTVRTTNRSASVANAPPTQSSSGCTSSDTPNVAQVSGITTRGSGYTGGAPSKKSTGIISASSRTGPQGPRPAV